MISQDQLSMEFKKAYVVHIGTCWVNECELHRLILRDTYTFSNTVWGNGGWGSMRNVAFQETQRSYRQLLAFAPFGQYTVKPVISADEIRYSFVRPEPIVSISYRWIRLRSYYSAITIILTLPKTTIEKHGLSIW